MRGESRDKRVNLFPQNIFRKLFFICLYDLIKEIWYMLIYTLSSYEIAALYPKV